MCFLQEHLLTKPGLISSVVWCCLSALSTPASPAGSVKANICPWYCWGSWCVALHSWMPLGATKQSKVFAWTCICTKILLWCSRGGLCPVTPTDMFDISSWQWPCCSISLLKSCQQASATEDGDQRIWDPFPATEPLPGVVALLAGKKDFPFISLFSYSWKKKRAWGKELLHDTFLEYSVPELNCVIRLVRLISWACLSSRILWCSSQGADLPCQLAAENSLGRSGGPGGISAWEPEGAKRGRVRVRTFGLIWDQKMLQCSKT